VSPPVGCPICGAGHFLIRRPGQRCGDLSRGQARPCAGRLISRDDLLAAEWRFEELPGNDPREPAILRAMGYPIEEAP
jgi:hypothetical protein